MLDAGSNENSWNELLKASRAWQLQVDVPQLIHHVAGTAQELLAFDQATVFLLERNGVAEAAAWPQPPYSNISPLSVRLEIAQGVVQAGRMAFIRNASANRTIICSPLLGSREIMGALYLETTNPSRAVTERDQQFIEMFAQQAAACLEHTRLYQSAITDPLTGLFSHRHFQQEVEQAIRRALRNERPVSLLLIDLDHFKKLNDTCGHSIGNQCLVQVAAAMRKTFRSTDVLARFGGDEFEMLLPDTFPERAQKLAENLRNQIGELTFPQDRRVTATIGIAGYPQNAQGAQALFLCADGALYKAKEAGRNRVLCASEKLGDMNVPTANRERAALLAGKLANHEGMDAAELQGDALVEKSNRVEIIDGHVVIRRLGIGSTGEVLLAVQPGLDREVALKRPLTQLLTPEQDKAFEQEAKVTASLSHPGIVPILGIGRDHDSRRYYTMVPLTGLSLEQILEARRKGSMEALHEFTPGRLLEILQRVAETVAFAHDRGVFHHDIRPANIMVGKFGEVTVIDWATGSDSAEHSASHLELKLVGSPAYLAPEVARGSPDSRSAACDVFALGTLLYFLLTDRLPFQRETTEATLNALISGEFTPAEFAVADAGIDSLLSALSTEALSLDPGKRPTSQAFAQRLGLYIRHESDWTNIHFGEGGHRLVESDWTVQTGLWKLKEDHWFFQDSRSGIIVWNPPVPGSFRFTCEGWVDSAGTELGLIGHRPSVGTSNHNLYSGYFFQFGAEQNTVTKLARNEADALCKPAGTMEPGRRYLIELEYQDQEGLLHCAVDGKRVFGYRELLPFPGSQIGFYAYGRGGAHFRPLKLERQNWNLQIPALRAADRLYQARHYADAITSYQEIATAMPGRPAGIEATLKIGMCQAAQGLRDEARESFHLLVGTALEPYALAEEAMFEAEVDPVRSLELFRYLFDTFPESQARVRIYDAGLNVLLSKCASGSRASDLGIRIEWNRIGARRICPPADSQIKSACRMADLQTTLGQSNEALQELLDFKLTLPPPRRSSAILNNLLAMTAVAAGQDHLVPDDLPEDHLHWKLMPHAARIGKLATVLRPETKAEMRGFVQGLLRRDLKGAVGILEQWMKGGSRASALNLREPIAVLLMSAGDSNVLDQWFSTGQLRDNSKLMYNGLLALNYGDFENAAKLLKKMNLNDNARGTLAWQVLLSSLGFLPNLSINEMSTQLNQMLCGPELELAEMFLGQREPQPTKRWPHPLWMPDRRLWLGLWLEAKGRKSEAIEVVTPSYDPRYGLTQCQPAIEALLNRLKA